MSGKVLVTYGSWAGSTAGVAEAIGKALSEKGLDVEVRRAKEVRDASPYSAVIVGSAVRAGMLVAEAKRFVQAHRQALAKVPVAYFVCCLTMSEPTEANRKSADAYLNPLRAMVQPVDVGLFGGMLDVSKLPKLLGMAMGKSPGAGKDFRDWAAIRAWAEALPAKMGIG
jgi:menaquinone-dependent protoporphyrinogen oxidase